MTLSRVNVFVPFEGAAASHENQLTRALLVLLRYSPMAHQAWLSLVAPHHHLHELSKAEFATQRGRVLEANTAVTEGEAIPGVSVWLAPDAASVNAPVASSDRQQILDGIITYGNDLVVVIESKVTSGPVTAQPTLINLHGSLVKFEKRTRSVAWQQLLDVLADLVEHNLVSGAEGLLVSDFFDLVEQHFERVGSYSTLARCGDHRFRIERRLDAIQGEAVGTAEPGKALGWRNLAGTAKIAMAWLGVADDGATVCLRMYPADTLGQARAFYGDPSSVDAVLALRSSGWRVEPNFHWGFMAPGYAWTSTPTTVEKYCAHWIEVIGVTRELDRSEWEAYWAKLEAAQVVEPAGKEGFDAEFTRSKRQRAHPRPGLSCEYSWPLSEARRLDAAGNFAGRVRDCLNQALTALNAPRVPLQSHEPRL